MKEIPSIWRLEYAQTVVVLNSHDRFTMVYIIYSKYMYYIIYKLYTVCILYTTVHPEKTSPRWLTLWRMLLQLYRRRVWVNSTQLLQALPDMPDEIKEEDLLATRIVD